MTMHKPAATRNPPDGGHSSNGRILVAAEELFSAHGFAAVSINDIALRAGVSKANVFHHFATKNALYLAVLRRAQRDAAAHLHSLEQDTGPLPARLASFSGKHLLRLLEQKQLSRLILRELLAIGPDRARELAENVFGENFRHFVLILRAGQQSGELRSDLDPAVMATTLLGANVFFFEAQTLLRQFWDVDFADSPERFTTTLIEIVLHGICPIPRNVQEKFRPAVGSTDSSTPGVPARRGQKRRQRPH